MKYPSLLFILSVASVCVAACGSDGSPLDSGTVDAVADAADDALTIDGPTDTASDSSADAVADTALDAVTDTALDSPADGTPDGEESLCEATGGTEATALCCATGADDFPDTCSIGACGCAPSSSVEVTVCDCPDGKCYSAADGCIDL